MTPKQVVGLCQYVSRMAGNIFSAFAYPFTLACSLCFGSRKARALEAEATKPQLSSPLKQADTPASADDSQISLQQREITKPAMKMGKKKARGAKRNSHKRELSFSSPRGDGKDNSMVKKQGTGKPVQKNRKKTEDTTADRQGPGTAPTIEEPVKKTSEPLSRSEIERRILKGMKRRKLEKTARKKCSPKAPVASKPTPERPGAPQKIQTPSESILPGGFELVPPQDKEASITAKKLTCSTPETTSPPVILSPVVATPSTGYGSGNDSDDEGTDDSAALDSLMCRLTDELNKLPEMAMSLPAHSSTMAARDGQLTRSLNSTVKATPVSEAQLTAEELGESDFEEIGLDAAEVKEHLSIMNQNPEVIDHLLSLIPEGDEPADEASLQHMVKSLPATTVSQLKELLPQTISEIDDDSAPEASLVQLHQALDMSLKPSSQALTSITEEDFIEEEYIPEGIAAEPDIIRSLMINSIRDPQPQLEDRSDAAGSSDEEEELFADEKEVLHATLAEAAKVDANRHSQKIEKKLNLHDSGSTLSRMLKTAEGVSRDEYSEIARAVAARAHSASQRDSGCHTDALKKHVEDALNNHVSRVHRLAPNLAETIRRQYGTRSHQPFCRHDIDQMADPRVIPREMERKAIKQFSPLLDQAQKLIFRPALSADSGLYSDQITEVDQTISQLSAMQAELENPESKTYYILPGENGHDDDLWNREVRDAVHQDIQILRNKLSEKKRQLEIIRDNDPRTVENLLKQAGKWSQAAIEAIEEACLIYDKKIEDARKASKGLQRGLMILARKKLEKERPDFQRARAQVADKAAALNTAYGDRSDELPTMVQDLDAYVKDMEKICREVKSTKLLESKMVDIMENQSPPAKTLHELPLFVDGELHKYSVEYTPMREMRLHAEGPDAQGDCNPLALTGFTPSQNRDSEHAQNLTCVVVKDPEDKVIRRELRVGSLIPIPKRIKKKNERRAIAQKRLNETLVGLVTHNQATIPGLAQALRGNQKAPIDLPFNYLCFLSPDKLRHNTGVHEDEWLMAREASDMLKELEGQERVLELLDSRGNPHKITFRFKPRMYIFPVNQLAFSTLRVIARPFELTDELNRKSMHNLIGTAEDKQGMPGGDAGEFIHSDHWSLLTPLEQDNFLALCREHRRSIENKNYHHGGTRAFYDIWLVDQISQIMNQPLMGGCKSAKDRTNNVYKSNVVDCCEADVRLKKALMDNETGSGAVKTSATDRLTLMPQMTTEERRQNQTVAHVVYGGLQQQNNNCGKYGYKVEGTTLAEVDPHIYELTMVK